MSCRRAMLLPKINRSFTDVTILSHSRHTCVTVLTHLRHFAVNLLFIDTLKNVITLKKISVQLRESCLHKRPHVLHTLALFFSFFEVSIELMILLPQPLLQLLFGRR